MSAITISLPALSQVQAMDTTYLREAASYWSRTADLWEESFADVHERMSTPANFSWKGRGADAARERLHIDLLKVRGASDLLRAAAAIATRGDERLQACREGVLDAVHAARADSFDIGDDFSVIDRSDIGSAEFQAARLSLAQGHAGFIHHRLAALVATDHQLTRQIATATQDVASLTFPEELGPGAPKDEKHGSVQPADYHWKQDPTPPPPTPPLVRGLPPDGVRPPISGNLTAGPASRPSEQSLGGQSLWDDAGGEWRYFPGDGYHNTHWDYNPHDIKFAKWQNVPLGDLPPVKEQLLPGERPPAPLPPGTAQPASPARPAPEPPSAGPPVQPAPARAPAPPPPPPATGIGGGGTIGSGGGGIPGHGLGPLHVPALEAE